jgi:hypothetical protein
MAAGLDRLEVSSMLGFHLDFWDYLTFASLAIMGIAVVIVIVFLGSFPGRIAIARKHPEAEAVR